MMETKSLFLSKTFWVNVLAVIAAIAGVFGIDIGLDPEAQTALVGGIMAVVNIVLRIVTKDAVHVIKSPETAGNGS